MYPLMTQTTLRTYRDWGPYFKPETNIHPIQNLADLISWSRYYMTDAIPDYIAVYKDDLLIGGWSAQGDAEPDGEGGMYPVFCGFDRVKPESWEWDNYLFHLTNSIKQSH